MTKKRSTKSALISSVLALFLCVSMLVGTTFAWFTDSVSTEMNKIVAGNLDIELDWTTDAKVGTSSLADDAVWSEVKEDTNIFGDSYWEPGHTEVVYLRIKNAGSLALRYRLNINVANEVRSTNVYGDEFKLSSFIEYAVLSVTDAYGTREAARAAIPENGAMPLDVAYAPERADLYPAENTPANKVSETIVALVVYMPEDVGNEANFAKGYNPPEVYLGINLAASQLEYEDDSYGDDYDAKADLEFAKDEIANITEAVNGNVTNNGTLNVTAPVTGNIENNGELNVNANVNGEITNNKGSIEISDADIAEVDRVIQNNGGDMTIKDTTITHTSKGDGDYIVRTEDTDGVEGTLVLDNVDATTYGGGLSIFGSSVVFNSGSIITNSTSTSARHVFFANNGSTLTINDGEFTFCPTNLTRKGYYVSATNGSTVVINGGTFAKPSSRNSYKNGFYADATSSITVYGGTFAFDPTNWVAAGHQAVYDATAKTWTVTIDATSINEALAAGKTVVLSKDLELSNNDKITVPAGVAATIDLNGNTIKYVSDESKASSAIDNKGTLTLTNGTVTYQGIGDASFGYGTNTINNSGKLVIDGATIINTTTTGSSVAIDCSAGAELIINSGNIKSEKNAIRLCPFGSAAISATVNGGTIEGARAIQIQLPSSNSASAPEITLTVNDGTLTSIVEDGLSIYSYSAGQSFANVNVTLAGGTYNGHVAFGGGAKATQETVTVTGGTFNGDLGRYIENDGWVDIVKP